MDHFRIHNLLELSTTADLFKTSRDRVHYKSLYRYPVLKYGPDGWSNYSAGVSRSARENPLLKWMIRDLLVPELKAFPDAWLVPIGPTPAKVLEDLARAGVIDEGRILAGINHPSGTQWNRHRGQLELVDHGLCSRNVGCRTIQDRSRKLEREVSGHLSERAASN